MKLRKPLGAVAAFGLMVGCGTPPPSAPTTDVKFGALQDNTGVTSQASWLDAMTVAEKHLADGLAKAYTAGNNPKNIKFVGEYIDSQSDATKALGYAAGLKTNGAKFLVLDTSADTNAVNRSNYDADTGNDIGLPMLCYSCVGGTINDPLITDPDAVTQATLRGDKKWLYKTIMSATKQGPILVALAKAKKPNMKKISIIASDEAFGRGFSGAVRTAFYNDCKARMPAVVPQSADCIAERVLHPPSTTITWADYVAKATDNKTDYLNADNQPAAMMGGALPDGSDGMGTTKMLGTPATASYFWYDDTKQKTDQAPDVVFETALPVYGAEITKAYKQGGANSIPMLHSSAFPFRSVLKNLAATANGEEGTIPEAPANSTTGNLFAEALKAQNAQWKTPGFADANAYDAVVMGGLAYMIAAKGVDDLSTITPEMVRDAILKVNDRSGDVVNGGADGVAAAVKLIAEGKPINYDGASGPCDWSQATDSAGAGYDARQIQAVLNRIASFVVTDSQIQQSAERYDCVADPVKCTKK